MRHVSRKLIEQLPKTDLHCHFDGSLRIGTVIELAKRHNIPLVSHEQDAFMKHMQFGLVRHSLTEYLLGFDPLIAVLQEPEDIERSFFEVCEDAASENVWHLELRYCPYLHTQRGMTSEEVVKVCIKAGKEAQEKLGISIKHILCGLKHDPVEKTLAMASLAAKYRHEGVVGFDLAGPEVGFPIKDHLKSIHRAQGAGLFVTLHAGESSGPDNILEALHEGHANRIGHGTSLLEDQQLTEYVIKHRIGIESCPISNWHTGSVKSLDEHPIKMMLNRGVYVSINTDNRLCSNTTVTEEIMAVIDHLDMTLEDIHKLLKNGFQTAFLSEAERARMIEKFDAEWLQLIMQSSV